MEFRELAPDIYHSPEALMQDLYLQAGLRYADALSYEMNNNDGLTWVSVDHGSDEAPDIAWFRLGQHRLMHGTGGESFEVGMPVTDMYKQAAEAADTTEAPNPYFYIRKRQFGKAVTLPVDTTTCMRYSDGGRARRTWFGIEVRPLVPGLGAKLQGYHLHPQ